MAPPPTPSTSRGPSRRLFLAGLIFLALVTGASADTTKVYLYNYDGFPLLIRAKKPVKLGIDVELFKNDRVEIDADSTAEITVHESGGIRLSANSSCKVIDPSKDHFHLLVEKGSFLVNLKHLENGLDFTISTPQVSAVAHVPTQFSGRIDPEDAPSHGTHVAIRKGIVDLQILESSSNLRLQEEMAVDAVEGSFIPAPRAWTPEEAEALRRVNTVPVLEPQKEEKF